MPGINLSKIPDEIHEPHQVMLAFRGSVAHGMYTGGEADSIDDIDLMGVRLDSSRHYLGFKQSKTREVVIDKWDYVSYEFRFFVHLLLKGNPNVLGMLWLNEEHYIEMSEPFQRLLDNRYMFVSQKPFYAFNGYAKSQYKRMQSQNYDKMTNSKRMGLIKRYGYDTKQASHCIRLLRMCIEFLETGVMNVDRTHIDAYDLLSIKRGEMLLSGVLWMIEDLLEKAKEAHEESALPEEPDKENAQELVMDVLYGHLAR